MGHVQTSRLESLTKMYGAHMITKLKITHREASDAAVRAYHSGDIAGALARFEPLPVAILSPQRASASSTENTPADRSQVRV
jgi:hypothetical protein